MNYNPFSVPPPNFKPVISSLVFYLLNFQKQFFQGISSWNDTWKSSQIQINSGNKSANSQQSQVPRPPSQTFQSHQNISNSSPQGNGTYVYSPVHTKAENSAQIHQINGNASTISMPPPPLPPYVANSKTSIYTTPQFMYPSR